MNKTKRQPFAAMVAAACAMSCIVLAAAPGCRKDHRQDAAEPSEAVRKTAAWWDPVQQADYSGAVPIGWPLCKPFVDDDYETVQGFLVVEKVKDHPNLAYADVRVGDVLLSWGARDPEVPETLRDAWLDFLNRRLDDEAVCWFARDTGGEIEVFPCDACLLYECMVSLGTFGLALQPTAFPEEDAERIRAAAAARKKANIVERAERLSLSPPLQEGVQAFQFAFKSSDGAWRGRVDTMYDNRGRLALWRRGRSLSALPDLVAEVARRSDESGGNVSHEPVGADNDPRFARLLECNPGTDEAPPLLLVMRTPEGEETKLAAQRATWWDLRIEQAASEPDPFVPERPEPGFEKTLHPSLLRTPFEPVLCFEADDGTLAGRIDHLPTKSLAEHRESWKRVDFDDHLEIYRIALFKCPVKAGDEPKTVFYATRRVNGTSGSHTYVDASWWYSLDVVVTEIHRPDSFVTELELNRWPVATPELGFDMRDACIPAHPVRWEELIAPAEIAAEPERAAPRACAAESPFATPLTPEEAAEPTGRDTPADADELFPPDLGFRSGADWWFTRILHPGLHKDGETGRAVLVRRLSEEEGRGDVSLEFDDGALSELCVFWGYDDGWTAADPGAVRKRLDETIRRLGAPTRRWTRVTKVPLNDGSERTDTCHVWHWSKGDRDAVFEIRRTDDATESLRASFCAGAIRKRSPDVFEQLGAPGDFM